MAPETLSMHIVDPDGEHGRPLTCEVKLEADALHFDFGLQSPWFIAQFSTPKLHSQVTKHTRRKKVHVKLNGDEAVIQPAIIVS